MRIPLYLKTGDRIRIVSPAGKVREEKVLPAMSWLRQNGYEVIPGCHAFNEYFQFSGTDEQRLNDLQEAFDDPDARAIFCSRGGYGLIRLVDRLDPGGFLKHPKWLVGFSDVTALHCWLNKLGFASIHGVMPKLFFDEAVENMENITSLFNLLTGKKPWYTIDTHQLNRSGAATGELVGGNLSLIYSLQATPFELRTKGKILFIEETGEYLYHIDRMMHNLKHSKKLESLKGLVVGDFSDVKDNSDPFGSEVFEIINESVKDYSYPVCFGFPAGHEKRNLALAFGMRWHLNVQQNGCLLKMM